MPRYVPLGKDVDDSAREPEPEKPVPARCYGCWLCCGCPQHAGDGNLFVPCRKCARYFEGPTNDVLPEDR